MILNVIYREIANYVRLSKYFESSELPIYFLVTFQKIYVYPEISFYKDICVDNYKNCSLYNSENLFDFGYISVDPQIFQNMKGCCRMFKADLRGSN